MRLLKAHLKRGSRSHAESRAIKQIVDLSDKALETAWLGLGLAKYYQA
jgi:hypothetical protein